MNYLVIGLFNTPEYCTEVAKYIYNHTENKPLVVQFNGLSTMYEMESYITADSLIDPCKMDLALSNIENVGKVNINNFNQNILTPYDNDFERIEKDWGDFKSPLDMIDCPKSILVAAKAWYRKDTDITLDTLFKRCTSDIEPYIEIMANPNDTFMDADLIYLSKVSLYNDDERGLNPYVYPLNLDKVTSESTEVYLCLDIVKETPFNIDLLNRLIDRHTLDTYKHFKYNIVIANPDNISQIQINNQVWNITQKGFILTLNKLYLHIDNIYTFKNNKLELWNP